MGQEGSGDGATATGEAAEVQVDGDGDDISVDKIVGEMAPKLSRAQKRHARKARARAAIKKKEEREL